MSSGNGPGAAGNSATSLTSNTSNTNLVGNRSALKRHRVLRALLAGPVTTFEAEKAPVFDHCLPSSVSELRKKDGVDIVATRITVAGYGGHPAHIARYTLTDAGRAVAQRILDRGA